MIQSALQLAASEVKTKHFQLSAGLTGDLGPDDDGQIEVDENDESACADLNEVVTGSIARIIPHVWRRRNGNTWLSVSLRDTSAELLQRF